MRPAALILALTVGVCLAQAPGGFREKLYPVLEKAQCRLCHNDNGVASRTRLQFPPEDATPKRSTRSVCGCRAWSIGFIRKSRCCIASRRIASSTRAASVSTRAARKSRSYSRGSATWPAFPKTSSSARQDRFRAAPAVVRRLTHSQYNQTVADLLGDQTRPADQFPQEDFINGFTNQAAGQSITPVQQEAYNRAAGKLARNAFLGGDGRGLIPCQASSPEDAACRTAVHPRVRPARVPATPRSQRSRALRKAVPGGCASHARFHEGRATRGRGHAAVAELSLPPRAGAGRSLRPVPHGQPLVLFSVGHHARPVRSSRLRRSGELRTPRRSRRPHGGCWTIRAPGNRWTCFWPQWLRFDRLKSARSRPSLLPGFQRRTGRRR